MKTLEGMRADIGRWVRESVSEEIANSAINDAIMSLWQSLILANVGSYISRKPTVLTDDDELIPFDELGALQFITYWSVHLLLLSVYEFDAAKAWESKAETARTQALQEVLQSSRREEKIEFYDPYNIGVI